MSQNCRCHVRSFTLVYNKPPSFFQMPSINMNEKVKFKDCGKEYSTGELMQLDIARVVR